MKKVFTALFLPILLASCASYVPVIDTKNVDMGTYQNDLSECQQYAQGESPGASAAVGAVAGALFGLALAKVGGHNYDSGASSRIGAVAGAASGAGSSAETQMAIIKNCLSGRGYRVLR